MTKRLYFTLLMIWISHAFGCADSTSSPTIAQNPPDAVVPCEIKDHESNFVLEARKRSITIESRIRYHVVPRAWFDASRGCNGRTTVACAEGSNIWLLDTYWNQASCYQREQTLFHELGHAVFGMGHYPSPHMMQPYRIDQLYYSEHRTELLDRFFKDARRTPRGLIKIWED